MKSKYNGRLLLTSSEKIRLAKIAKRMGQKALKDVGPIFKPDTILGWYRSLVAQKFDDSKNCKHPGRPKIAAEVEDFVLQFALQNPRWGYDRIVGALANLGYTITDATVANILKRHGIPPAPRRKPKVSKKEFIESHQEVIAACDFFTTEVLTAVGLMTYYVLVFMHIGSRRVYVAGITVHPTEAWMKQIARNETMDTWGFLKGMRYLIMDRDAKFCDAFRGVIRDAGYDIIRLTPKSPNLNAFIERWILSIKTECLSHLVLFSQQDLRRAIETYLAHYHQERNHQGLNNVIPFPKDKLGSREGEIECQKRLGGLLKYYRRKAA